MSLHLIIISAIVLVTVDSIYLNMIKNYFNHQINLVQNSPAQLNLLGAALCYLLLIFGINYFIIQPRKTLLDAFLFGIVVYGVYETTNYALLKNWSIYTVLIDTLWGGILFTITTYIVNLLAKYI